MLVVMAGWGTTKENITATDIGLLMACLMGHTSDGRTAAAVPDSPDSPPGLAKNNNNKNSPVQDTGRHQPNHVEHGQLLSEGPWRVRDESCTSAAGSSWGSWGSLVYFVCNPAWPSYM